MNRAQLLSKGSIIISIEDGKKLPSIQQQLRVFLACMQTGERDNCHKGKKCIDSGLNQLLIVTGVATEKGEGKGAE